MAWITQVPVRFADVDFARIAYYPKLLHLLHIAFEELIEKHVGIPYAKLVGELHVGFPSVHLDCDFRAPIRFGEVLQVAQTVPRMGRSSLDFAHRVTVLGPDDLRADGTITRVCVDMRTLHPQPIPEDLRRAFSLIQS